MTIMEAVEVGGLALGYGRQGAHVAPFWRALSFVSDPYNAPCVTDGYCSTYLPNSGIVQWLPQNPFTQPNLTPNGYLIPPWTEAKPPLSNLPFDGIQSGDVFTWLGAIPIAQNLADLLTDGYPRFKITLVGEGTVELHLLNIPQGGRAAVVVDGNFANIDFVELNRDILSAPPETSDVFIWEKEITGAGLHTIEVTMLWTVDDNVLPVQFGGGLRKIVLCGFDDLGTIDTVEMRTDGCFLQWRQNSNSAWLNLFNLCEWLDTNEITADIEYRDDITEPDVNVQVDPSQTGQGINYDFDFKFPRPKSRAIPILGGHSLEFDMDGNDVYEQALSIFNGVDGLDGTNAPPIGITVGSTQRVVDGQIQNGTIVYMDTDGDAIPNEDITIWDGLDGVDGSGYNVPALPELTDAQICGAAHHIAAWFQTKATDAISRNYQGQTLWAIYDLVFKDSWQDYTPIWGSLKTMNDAIDIARIQLGLSIETLGSEIFQSSQNFECELYCLGQDIQNSEIVRQTALNSIGSGLFPGSGGYIFGQLVQTMPEEQIKKLVADGASDETQDCSSCDCGGDGDLNYNASLGWGNYSWVGNGTFTPTGIETTYTGDAPCYDLLSIADFAALPNGYARMEVDIEISGAPGNIFFEIKQPVNSTVFSTSDLANITGVFGGTLDILLDNTKTIPDDWQLRRSTGGTCAGSEVTITITEMRFYLTP